MNSKILAIIVGFFCIGGGISLFFMRYELVYEGNKVDSFLTFEAKNGFEIIYNSGADQTIESYYTTGTVVINGSYFGMAQSGVYYPAGLWNIRGQQYYNEKIDQDDPNLSRIALYDHAGGTVLFLDAKEKLPECAKRSPKNPESGKNLECSVFQAGPLVLSGGHLQDFSRSWHALEPHERTLMGTTEEGKIYFFVFPEKVTLSEAGESIKMKFQNEPMNLLNLDGGPSTAYFDGKQGFGQMKKLPIILRINVE